MTRRFQWVEPGEDGVTPVVQTITEQEILASYFPHWCEQMRKVSKADQISAEHCIEDFVTVHLAVEVP